MDYVKKKPRYRILFFMVRKQDTSDLEHKALLKKRIKNALLWTMLFVVMIVLFHPNGQLPIENKIAFTKTLQPRDWKLNISQNAKQEERHIAFLKVHKAASSTIQNILFRFGTRRNLTIVIPVKEFKFSERSDSHAPLLDPVYGSHYDIFALHAVFNYSTFTSLMPPDTFYIAIVRNPLDLMISSAYYHRDKWDVSYLKRVPTNTFIQSLIQFPEKYDTEQYSLTKNAMAKDFGFPLNLHVQNSKQVEEHVQNIGRIFQFVMVFEHFAESLILLKRRLNWETSAILYVPLNGNEHKSADELNITELDRRKFKDRNFLDSAIYEHFYNRFIVELSRQDEDFFAEVDNFKALQRRVEVYCLHIDQVSRPLDVSETRWNERFLVLPNDCDEMMTSELLFIDILRKRQIRRLDESL